MERKSRYVKIARLPDGKADSFNSFTVNGRAWYKAFTVQWFLTRRQKQLPAGEYYTTFNDPNTSFTDTRDCGFTFFRSWMSCARSSIE